MNTEVLENLGLTRNQAIIYLSLLKLGSSTAVNIIKESKLHSSRVYANLERLGEMGLVTFVVKDYKKYFQAVPPEKLFSYLDEKRLALKKEFPELKRLEGLKKEEINASLFKGKEGIKTILSKMLREKKDMMVLGAKGMIFRELKFFMPNFDKERVKKKIKYICLYDREERKKVHTKMPYVEGKTLPHEAKSESIAWIFGNNVAIIHWEEHYPSAFLIEKKEIADSFRKWFELIWDNI